MSKFNSSLLGHNYKCEWGLIYTLTDRKGNHSKVKPISQLCSNIQLLQRFFEGRINDLPPKTLQTVYSWRMKQQEDIPFEHYIIHLAMHCSRVWVCAALASTTSCGRPVTTQSHLIGQQSLHVFYASSIRTFTSSCIPSECFQPAASERCFRFLLWHIIFVICFTFPKPHRRISLWSLHNTHLSAVCMWIT